MKPKRIQRKRTKGWRMPENTIYVGRPTIWGNPFNNIKDYKNLLTDKGYILFESQMYIKRSLILKRISELKGKNLACWCPLDQPCHADILLE